MIAGIFACWFFTTQLQWLNIKLRQLINLTQDWKFVFQILSQIRSWYVQFFVSRCFFSNTIYMTQLEITMYFIGRVALFFANNSSTQCRITMKFSHNFFDPEVIFSSHTMFIDASSKVFTLVNNAIPSYDMAVEHLLYYR